MFASHSPVSDTPHGSLLFWPAGFGRVGGYSGGETPGPIPNPEAKPAYADGTALGRVWESRSPPALIIVGGSWLLFPLCGVVAAARFCFTHK